MTKITAQRLRDVLSYDSETGEFRWTVTMSNRATSGRIAGYLDNEGYVRIRVDGITYRAHRLAILYVTGDMPKHEVDHLDGNKSNNKIANLRDIPHEMNAQNIRRPKIGRKEPGGMLGVERRGARWRAVIWYGGKNHNLGTYDTSEEAHSAYLAAKRALHAGCTICGGAA